MGRWGDGERGEMGKGTKPFHDVEEGQSLCVMGEGGSGCKICVMWERSKTFTRCRDIQIIYSIGVRGEGQNICT